MVNEQQQGEPGAQLDAKGAARRRFTRAGAAASGVLLTLHSQPGMAVQACTTPSGFHSLNYGGSHNPKVGSCAGFSPGAWGQSLLGANNQLKRMKWWEQVNPDATKFVDLFGYCGAGSYAALGGNTATLRKLLTDGNSIDQNQLGVHMVCAWLNFHFGFSAYPDKLTLKAMWTAFINNNGWYTPNAGAKPWNADMIKFYLTNTWK